MAETIYTGGCLCEGVRFSILGRPEKVFACFCIDCSKNAGGPYQILAKYPKTAISVAAGSDLLEKYVITKTSSGSEKHKIFCRRCACTLWTVPMRHGGTHYIVRTSLIENGLNLEEYQPHAEFFASLRPKWLSAIEGAKCFDTMPGN